MKTVMKLIKKHYETYKGVAINNYCLGTKVTTDKDALEQRPGG